MAASPVPAPGDSSLGARQGNPPGRALGCRALNVRSVGNSPSLGECRSVLAVPKALRSLRALRPASLGRLRRPWPPLCAELFCPWRRRTGAPQGLWLRVCSRRILCRRSRSSPGPFLESTGGSFLESAEAERGSAQRRACHQPGRASRHRLSRVRPGPPDTPAPGSSASPACWCRGLETQAPRVQRGARPHE